MTRCRPRRSDEQVGIFNSHVLNLALVTFRAEIGARLDGFIPLQDVSSHIRCYGIECRDDGCAQPVYRDVHAVSRIGDIKPMVGTDVLSLRSCDRSRNETRRAWDGSEEDMRKNSSNL